MNRENQYNRLGYLIVVLICMVIYSNTFNSSWHLDDIPNIVDNFYLHIDNISIESVVKTFYTDPTNPHHLSKKMYRPVACLSLALNWYFGKDNVFGYHVVNITIHTITAFFLYLFLLNLLNFLQRTKYNHKYFTSFQIFIIAFYTALFWAVHPIQTQAVTYIVQRMASMSAMFYIMGMFFYLKGRLSTDSKSKSCLWYICCIVCFILSVGSKENGIMMPISILLVEIIFFRDLSDKQTIKKLFIASVIAGLILFVLATILFLNKNPLSILNYQHRTFSLTERLLVQPRVLVFHLSQIFFPLPDQFSIAHDFVLSSSPFKPWTTIPAILIIFSLIGSALYQIKTRPLLSFVILFFFINHIVESTIIPLEIVFEHRNYLPSMFLFLPIIFWCSQLINRFYEQKQSAKYWLIIGLLITVAISLSVSTYIRNKVWKDDITLWSDAYKKAPFSARALDILAMELAWGNRSNHPNRYDMAIQLFEKALRLDMPSINKKADILANMAAVYSNNKKDYKKSVLLFKEALSINPESLKIRQDMAKTFNLMENYEQALENIEIVITRNDQNWEYHNMKGFILLWQGKYDDAFTNFQRSLSLLHTQNAIPSNALLFNTGVTLSLKGHYKIADEILGDMIKEDMLAEKVNPDNMPIYLALIENSLRAGDKIQAQAYASQMVVQFGKEGVLQNISLFLDNRASAPISRKVVEPFIRDFIKNM